jgi:hypothetical protein
MQSDLMAYQGDDPIARFRGAAAATNYRR